METLDSQEKAFDSISSFIKLFIIFPREFAILFWGNNWNISLLDYQSTGFIAFISLIHNQMAMDFIIGCNAQQFSSFRSITCIPAWKWEWNRRTIRCGDQMNFCCEFFPGAPSICSRFPWHTRSHSPVRDYSCLHFRVDAANILQFFRIVPVWFSWEEYNIEIKKVNNVNRI